MYRRISKKKYGGSRSRPIKRFRTNTRSKRRSKYTIRSRLISCNNNNNNNDNNDNNNNNNEKNFNQECQGIIAPTSGETYTESVLAVIIDILGVIVDKEINGLPIKRHEGCKDADKKARDFIREKPNEAFLINITYDDGGVHFLSYNPLIDKKDDKKDSVVYNPYDYHQITKTNQFCQTFALIHLLGLEQKLKLQIAHNPKLISDQKKYVDNAYIALRYGVNLIRKWFSDAQQTFEMTKSDSIYGLGPEATLEKILCLADLILARHSNTDSEFRNWVTGNPFDVDNPRRSSRRLGH